MKRLLVYADFDWLRSPELVGELSYDSIRGSDSYGFSYDRQWLKKHSGVFLSSELGNFPEMQYSRPGSDIFGCFTDALPDRWGRTLLNRREQLLAAEESRAARRLSSFDYLRGIDDFSRMGGFRFREEADSEFINTSQSLKIPPLTSIRELEAAASEIEKSELQHLLPERKWLVQLIQPGTSLGGARPKASLVDEYNNLYIAKFPSANDDYDMALWEHLAHLLAQKAGITTAQTRLTAAKGSFHTLLSLRFDRTSEHRRIHFASALTLLGLSDGDNASSGKGYPDIVDFILQNSADADKDLEELFRRVTYNICIGNSDDHFRNHGFLLGPNGWQLAPAYDMNPTLNTSQSLIVGGNSNEADLHLLYDSCQDYMIEKERARNIINQVTQAVSHWRELALSLNALKRDTDYFAPRLESQLKF